jgi:hypothetical protein
MIATHLVRAGTNNSISHRPAQAAVRTKQATIFSALVLGALLVMSFGFVNGHAYGVSSPAVNQCNGTDNVGGQAVACTVNVINTLNLATGIASTQVTGTECHGAAHAPPTCIPWTAPSNQLTTSVTQCNGSGSGGGGTVTCTVGIVNEIVGNSTTSPATVNQCNGTAQGGGTQPTLVCDPIGNTTNASFTQCNGSGNGGGGTMRVLCTVGPSTATSSIPISVNQCVGSGNGGGSTVTCSISETNHVIAASSSTNGGTGGTTGGGGSSTGTGGGGSSTGTGTGTPSASGSPTATGVPTGTGTGTPSGNGLGTISRTPGVGTPPGPGVPTGNLAHTGSNIAALVLLGLLTLALGTMLALVARRSDRASPSVQL